MLYDLKFMLSTGINQLKSNLNYQTHKSNITEIIITF